MMKFKKQAVKEKTHSHINTVAGLSAAVAAAVLAIVPGHLSAAETAPGVETEAAVPVAAGGSASAKENELAKAANDPTASLMAFQLQNFYSPALHNSDEDRNMTQFRAAIPYELFGTNNIARLSLPYFTDTASGATGLGDATIFNLTTFDRSWGRIGVGAVGLIPTGADGVSAEKWGLGPAAGFITQQDWGLAGVFNQNIFTVGGDDAFDDVNVSIIQPIVNKRLGKGWAIGTSEMNITYDWDAGEFTSLPVGVSVSKLTKGAGVPIQYIAAYERDFYDEGMGPKDTISLTAKLLLPK